MAVLNFPASPSNGDTYSENGVTYTYSGTAPNGFWKADNQNVVDDVFVNINGDTMTGDLAITPLGGGGDRALYVDNVGNIKATNGSEVITTPFVDKAGDTMSGNLVFAAGQISNSEGELKLGGTGTISASNTKLELRTTSSSVYQEFNINDSKRAYIGADTNELQLRGVDGPIVFFVGNASGLSSTEVARFDDAGKFGIGVTPNFDLHVHDSAGSATIQLTNGTVGSSSADGARITESTSGILYIENLENASTVFTTNNTERMYIDAAGRVLIGASSGTEQLEVHGDTATVKLRDTSAYADGSGPIIQFQGADSNGDIRNFAEVRGVSTGNVNEGGLSLLTRNSSNTSERLGISPTGLVKVSGGMQITENITPTSGAGLELFKPAADASQISSFDRSTSLWMDLRYKALKHEFYNSGNVKFLVDENGHAAFNQTSVNSNRQVEITQESGSTSGLRINADPGGGAGAFYETFSGVTGGTGANWKFGAQPNTTTFKLYKDGAQILEIAGPSNVGIGAVAGSETLEIGGTGHNGHGTANVLSVLGLGPNLNSGRGLWFGARTDENTGVIGTKTDSGNLAFETYNGGWAERMRLTNDGRFLFGTQTPSGHSNRHFTIGDVTFGSNYVEVRGGTSAGVGIVFSDEANGVINGTDGYRGSIEYQHGTNEHLFLRSGGAKRMQIDGTSMVRILGEETSGVLNIFSTQSAASNKNLILGQHSATDINGTSASTSFVVFTNGNVVNTNNSYGALSDIKLKENIRDVDSMWDSVKAVRFVKYEFKDKQAHGEGERLGVIAQELEQISPSLVEETDDTQVVEVPLWNEDGSPMLDEEGNQRTEFREQPTGTTTKNVKYSVLTLKFQVALQEAMARIEALEGEIAALKS